MLLNTSETNIKSILSKLKFNDVIDTNLFLGELGKILYLSNINEFDKVKYLINKTFTVEINNFSLIEGYTGLGFIYTYLYKEKKLIGINDLNRLRENDNYLIDWALKSSNFDYLYGSLGAAYYMLYIDTHINLKFTRSFNINLKDYINNFLLQKRDDLNFGLAHGILSFLKYYLQCYKMEIDKKKNKEMIYLLISFISNFEDQNSLSILPLSIENGKCLYNNRMAWCYGDLSYGYILNLCGKITDNIEYTQRSLNVIKETMKKNTMATAGIREANFCHGSSSLFYIYFKLYLLTQNIDFFNQSNMWLNATIYFKKEKSDEIYFESYNEDSINIQKNDSLLLGSTGISLAMNSLLSNDYSWDYCLMLND